MKKKLFALSGVFLIVLVITGLWATKATDLMSVMSVPETSNPVAATSQVPGLPMEKMTQESSLIFRGKCIETKSVWNDRSLFTLATVSVEEAFKGHPGNNVTVALPGGIASDRKFPIAMTYPGAPQIYLDEEVFLFVTDQGEIPGSHTVVGFAAGKYSIGEYSDGEKFVARDLSRVKREKGMGVTRGNPQATRLSEFIEMVKGYLEK